MYFFKLQTHLFWIEHENVAIDSCKQGLFNFCIYFTDLDLWDHMPIFYALGTFA